MATFYLKYRPQTVSELDLDSVRVSINSVLKAREMPHAFLFSGPRGLGKTSAARILAKGINCEKPVGIEPCNKCDSCKTITEGSAIDVIEIDGASNRGIDDVRALRESVSQTPLRLKKKIYVIDEVHMLTREAFNALLKTLEEPPEHVVFILATTEPHKIPETIISRAFHIQFHRASSIEVKRSLKRVIEGEKLEVEEKVLDLIVSKVDGGFRDGAKMLEQLAFVSKNITSKIFGEVFPQADVQTLFEFLKEKDTKKALEWINKSHEDGVDWEETIRTILNNLKEMLMEIYGVNSVISNQKSEFGFREEEIRELIKLFDQVGRQIKYSLVATLPIEMAVVEWSGKKIRNYELRITEKEKEDGKEEKNTNDELSTSSADRLITNEEKNKKQEEIRNQKREEGEKEEIQNSNIKTQNQNSKVKNEEEIRIQKSEFRNQKEEEKEEQETGNKKQETRGDNKNLKFGLGELKEKWDELLREIKPDNYSVEALLRSAQAEEVNNGMVTIKVYYAFHKERLETEKCLQIVEKGFVKTFGQKPRICYILGEKREKIIIEEKKDKELEKDVEEIFG